MQIRQASCSSTPPQCPFDHDEQASCLHRHGHYERFVDTDSSQRVRIQRFYCRFVGRTVSILPDDMLPYRALAVRSVQEHFDQQCHDPNAHTRDPSILKSSVERGCLRRAWHRFSNHRHQSLADFFGQRLPLTDTALELWQAIRHTAGDLANILLELAREGKSLLGDYRCLSPN